MTTTKIDPLFAAYAKSAPREDLRVYVRFAKRRLRDYELPEQAVRVAAEMTAMLAQLEGVDGTPALKARVLSLITRFKASIPNWAGDPWKRGRMLERKERKASARGIGADGLERLRAWYFSQMPAAFVDVPVAFTCEKCKKTLAAPRAEIRCDDPCLGHLVVQNEQQEDHRCPPRAVRLTEEQVDALIQSAMPEQTTVAAAKPKPVNWRALAAAHEARVRELERQLAALQRKPAPAVRVARVRPQLVAPVVDGQKTCTVCQVEQAIVEFMYADGGRTVRNMCKSCRKAQQAARRKAA